MSRYIDADKLIQSLEREEEYYDNEGMKMRADGIRDALIDILSMQTADVVEVVRCKDCKYWLKTTLTTVDGESVYDCPLLSEWGDEDGYCSFAERRTNETD